MDRCYYDELGKSFAGGHLAFAAPDRRKFDPSADVGAEQGDIVARIIGNCATLTYVELANHLGASRDPPATRYRYL